MSMAVALLFVGVGVSFLLLMIKKVTSINRVGMLTGITKRDMIIILAGTKSIINIGVFTAKDIVTGRFIKSGIIIIIPTAMRHVKETLSDLK